MMMEIFRELSVIGDSIIEEDIVVHLFQLFNLVEFQ